MSIKIRLGRDPRQRQSKMVILSHDVAYRQNEQRDEQQSLQE